MIKVSNHIFLSKMHEQSMFLCKITPIVPSIWKLLEIILVLLVVWFDSLLLR
ncbi:hypothetical protein Hanom_Chr10g00955311 [Helianthus anomalus]